MEHTVNFSSLAYFCRLLIFDMQSSLHQSISETSDSNPDLAISRCKPSASMSLCSVQPQYNLRSWTRRHSMSLDLLDSNVCRTVLRRRGISSILVASNVAILIFGSIIFGKVQGVVLLSEHYLEGKGAVTKFLLAWECNRCCAGRKVIMIYRLYPRSAESMPMRFLVAKSVPGENNTRQGICKQGDGQRIGVRLN